MPLFGKDKSKASTPDSSHDLSSTDPSPAMPVEATSTPTDALSQPASNDKPFETATDAPAEPAPKKAGVFARLKKPQRPHINIPGRHKQAPTKNQNNSNPDLTSAVQNLIISDDTPVTNAADSPPAPPAPPVDPAKAARRAARRAERNRKEEEWKEEDRRRRNDAVLTGLDNLEQLEPLSDFDSASEDEKAPVVVAEGVQHMPTPSPETSSFQPSDTTETPLQPPQRGPFIPPNPAALSSSPTADLTSAPSNPLVPASNPIEPAHLPQTNAPSDANMAEMFGAQAFSGTQVPSAAPAFPGAPPSIQHSIMYQPSAPPQSINIQPPMQLQNAAQHAGPPLQMQPPPTHNPTPIGWGGVYSGVISQPVHGAPPHLTARAMAPVDVDPMLADKIRRGRELALLAIEQEEQGNMGAAESGYMKALSLLIPASKELDVGSELTKASRMRQKEKIQREASAMLDRCEELRLFLKANGPSVPQEIPDLPSSRLPPRDNNRGGGGSGTNSNGNGGGKGGNDRDGGNGGNGGGGEVEQPKIESKIASTARLLEQSNEDLKPTPPTKPPLHMGRPPPGNINRPPPPAPPAFESDNDDDLFNRMAVRKNILNTTQLPRSFGNSMHIPGGALTSAQVARATAVPPAVAKSDQKCFMCNAAAEVAAPCGHTFCTSCGNQAVTVFGKCPVPGCNNVLSRETFRRIA